MLLNNSNKRLNLMHLTNLLDCALLYCTHLLLWDIKQQAVVLRLGCDTLCTCQAFKHNGVYHRPLDSTPWDTYIEAAAQLFSLRPV